MRLIQFYKIFNLTFLFSIFNKFKKKGFLGQNSIQNEPLEQKIKAPIFESFKVNGEIINLEKYRNDQLITFNTTLKSYDTVEIKIKNNKFDQMGFSASLQFYDKDRNVKTLTTNYIGWSCDGFIPAKFISKLYSIGEIATIGKSKEKEPIAEEYSCSVTIPKIEPLKQIIESKSYLTEIKINGKALKIYDDKLFKNTVPYSFVLNSNDKIDVKIRSGGSMTLLAILQYYDPNGNIKTFNTEYVDWTCDGIVGVKINQYNSYKVLPISKSKGSSTTGETYWCSVIVPIEEPLSQNLKVYDHIQEIKINNKVLPLQIINSGETIPFSYTINSGDTIDVKINTDKGPMSLYGEIQYYNKDGEINKLNTTYLGWKCNGKTAVKLGSGFNTMIRIAQKLENENAGTEYTCSTKIPDMAPLLQKIKANDYFLSLKVNDEPLSTQNITINQEIPLSWIFYAGDKIDIEIKNNKGSMALIAKIQYYDKKGNVRKVTTDYTNWTCDNLTPFRTRIIILENMRPISREKFDDAQNEAYTCSVVLPEKEPLEQYIRAQDILIKMEVNNEEVKIEQYEINNVFKFTHILNSKDKVDITMESNSFQIGLSAKLQYYDNEGNIKILSTEDSGWTCDGQAPALYENRVFSADGTKFIGKTNIIPKNNEMLTCSVVIP